MSEMLEFATSIGVDLDGAQEFILRHAMGTVGGADRWAARTVGVCAPRQNGKTLLLAVRALYGTVMVGERLVVHSAQLVTTSVEQFRATCELVQGSRLLSKRLARIDRGRGNECIEFVDGARIVYRARSGMSLRGMSLDCVILDEAMYLPEAAMAAIEFALSARPNAQIWYAGSAVDQDTMPDGVVFARIRELGIGGAPRLAWFEWSVDAESPFAVTGDMLADRTLWAVSNSAYNRRILEEVVEHELLTRRSSFATERLGVGNWPRTDGGADLVIPLEAWDACEDQDSRPVDPVWMAFDVDPDRQRATVAIAGFREDDDLIHVEAIEHFRSGIAGVVPFLIDRFERHDPAGVVCESASPAASLLAELTSAGVPVTLTTGPEFARAYGMIVDGVGQETIRHRGGGLVRDALRVATWRPLSDGRAWSRKNSMADITPLVAVTLALWGANSTPPGLATPDYFSVI